MDRLGEDPTDLTGATEATIRHVTRVCSELGVGASLNLAVTNGTEMVFTRYSTEGPGNSLYFVEYAAAFPGAIVVASERLDGDEAWREVPDRHLLAVVESGASVRPLRGPAR